MQDSSPPQGLTHGLAAAWPRLVLGSTSPYRRTLLGRLGLPFDTCSPRVDEQALPGESPMELARRLAIAKAQDVAAQLRGERYDSAKTDRSSDTSRKDVIVIGSDQVADLHGTALGKPGHHEGAVAQLRAMSGQRVVFHTAVSVVRPATGYAATRVDSVVVRFRDLTDDDIQAYLQAEQPFDCAGSAKAEELGIVLLEAIESNDPTALIGLPLITTTAMMREAGADVLHWRAALAGAQRAEP